jgi:hypothetical protein
MRAFAEERERKKYFFPLAKGKIDKKKQKKILLK